MMREINRLRSIEATLIKQLKEYEASFDLRWKADRRAIKMWQAAHLGNDLVWPDHADLRVWLRERLQEAEAERDTAEKAA